VKEDEFEKEKRAIARRGSVLHESRRKMAMNGCRIREEEV
jgi:hypothetical protein